MTLDVYVNDRSVGNVPMPNDIQCNSLAAPIQGQFDLSSNPIAGQGSGKEFEIRFQLTGTADKLLPEVLKGQDLTKLTTGKVEEVGKNFLEKTLEQALSAGTGMLSLWSGECLDPRHSKSRAKARLTSWP